MTVTATYLDDLSRVRVAFSGAPADADYAIVERTTDGVNYSTVRGGLTVSITAGAGKVDDYEFKAGVANTYRVTYVDTATVQPNGTGTFTTGNNATLNPPLPASPVVGQMMLLFVTHANTAASITTPTGWTRLANGSITNMAVFYRAYQTGDTAPSVAFTGGSAGDSCSAHIRAWTNAQAPIHVVTQSNSSAQDVAYPGGTVPQNGVAWILHMWKKSNFTTGAIAPSSFGDPQGGTNSAGANTESNLTWRTDATINLQTVLPGTSAYTGGSAAISKARLLYLIRRDYVSRETAGVTPVLDGVWIKNISRPSQNAKVKVTNISDVTRPSRVGIYEVIGRTMPIAVTDVQGSRRLTLTLWAGTLTQASDLDARLATGETLFIQGPPDTGAINAWPLDAFYAVPGDIAQGKRAWHTKHRFIDLPLIEVAAPDPVITGDTILWMDVPTTWATWADVITAKTTWSNLQDSISTGTVIVP